jgi:hypothetical protein
MSTNNWRQREIEKVRARKEQERKLAEEMEQKKIQKTEQNFPSVIPQTPQQSTTVFEKNLPHSHRTGNKKKRDSEH